MPVTSSSDMDALDWSRAVDQFGNIDSDGSAGYLVVDTTVKTIDGVTYVVGSFENGDIQLHTYTDDDNDGVYEFTKLGHYQGGSGTGDTYAGFGKQYSSPTIEKFGDTLVITADTENDHTAGFTFDLTSDPTTFNPDTQGIEFRDEFLIGQNTGAGTTNDQLETFDVNGTTYYLHVGDVGDLKAFTVEYDAATDQLTYVEHQDFDTTQFNADNPFLGSKLARTDTLDNNDTNILATGIRDTSFTQKDDGTIYSYSTGVNGLYVAKWEVESDGTMTAAQVVYTDGTTTKDMHDAGYVHITSYPAISPFDPNNTATSLTDFADSDTWGSSSANWLQEIAQVSQRADAPSGIIDTIDLENLRNVESFEIDGQEYLFVNTWAGSENGAAVFSVDSATGLPDQLMGFEEISTGRVDADDDIGISVQDFTDITIQTLAATGETIITVSAGPGYMQLKFDPSVAPSAMNGQGMLSYIGNDSVNNTNSGFLPDTNSGGSPMTGTGAVSQYDLLPDGKVLGNNNQGYWVADPGLTTTTAPPPICFVAGTLILTDQGEVDVDNLRQGDLVVTKDNGLQPIRWIGKRTYLIGKKSKSKTLRPIRISAGSLGENTPRQDLYVSPQHRVLVKSKIARRMCGFDEVLVAAKQLLEIDGIDIVEDCGEVTYIHILLDQHEVVYSNGAETETLYTGPEALKSVTVKAREEVMMLFPEIADLDYKAEPSRTILSGRVSRKLAYRHLKNNKQLYAHHCAS